MPRLARDLGRRESTVWGQTPQIMVLAGASRVLQCRRSGAPQGAEHHKVQSQPQSAVSQSRSPQSSAAALEDIPVPHTLRCRASYCKRQMGDTQERGP